MDHASEPVRSRIEYRGGPVIRWLPNIGNDIKGPSDADDWKRIVRKQVPAVVRLDFVATRGERWRVHIAEGRRLDGLVGPGPYANPLDLRSHVTAALRQAGKPVDD